MPHRTTRALPKMLSLYDPATRSSPPDQWLRLLITSCLLIFLSTARAEDLRYLNHQSWSTEEGLPQSSVHSILQTRDGYLWIATEAGLVRFDGITFKVFNRETTPQFLSEDICCLASIPSEKSTAFDTLWIGTSDGLLQMEGQRFRRFDISDGLPSSTISSLQLLTNGSLLVSTNGGFAQWNKQHFQPVSAAKTIPHSATDQPRSITDPKGTRWTYSATSISFRSSRTERVWQTGRDLPQGHIETVLIDRDGLAWVGTTHGLVVLNPNEASATRIAALGGNAILSVFQDAEGNHWIGTETSGLHVLRQLKFRSEPAFADKPVTCVTQTLDGAIWIGTRDDGLHRLRNGQVDEPVPQSRLTSSVILSLAPAINGGVWAGTPDGLNFIDSTNSVRHITSADGLPDDYVRSLAPDPDGSLWIGTRHGLAHLIGSTVVILTAAEGLGGDMIGSLLLAPGKSKSATAELWVGTSGGLSRITPRGKISTYGTRDGLPAPIVAAMALDSKAPTDSIGNLWVATKGGGLSFFDGQRFLPTTALPTNAAIEEISADHYGYLWFQMKRGVRRISLATLHECISDRNCELSQNPATPYGVADGLPSDEIVPGISSIAWLTTNGELWFPTRRGVAIVDTENLPTNTTTPPVVLQGLLLDDTSIPLDDKPIEIPFGHPRLTIEYAGLNFTAPSETRYRFKLEGFDRAWIDAGSRRAASYTNLPPGSYRFHVEAVNSDGVSSSTDTELQFRIIPPFYRRWWFIALVLLTIMAILAGLYFLRLKRLRVQFDAVLAERNRMAREIHDTLTQDFVATSLQLDITSQLLNRGKVDLAIEQVKRTRSLVSEGLNEARRSIWELRANNSQDSLPTRLTRLVERDTAASPVPKVRLGGAFRTLNPQIERELLRITQEALTNIQHHAQATEASVELYYSSDTLMLVIEDNGVGFSLDDAARKSGHFGLIGMKERAALVDGTFEITSEPGHGSKITLRVPYPAARTES